MADGLFVPQLIVDMVHLVGVRVAGRPGGGGVDDGFHRGFILGRFQNGDGAVDHTGSMMCGSGLPTMEAMCAMAVQPG